MTVSFPADSTPNAVTFNEFQGFLSPKVTDAVATADGSSSGVSSGFIMTAGTNDLLFGSVAWNSGATFSVSSATPPWNAAGAAGGSSKRVKSSQRPVFTTGGGGGTMSNYAGTMSGSASWNAAIVAYKLETLSPSSSITFPGHGTFYNTAGWIGSITGTASDDPGGAGVASVGVSIKRLSDNKYWNGTSFGSAAEIFNYATGTTSWDYAFAAANLTDGVSYIIRSQAKDDAGNTEPLGSGVTVTFDTTAPSSTISFPTAGSYSPGTWTGALSGTASDSGATPSGVNTVQVSIRQGTGNYWNGGAFGSATESFFNASGTTMHT